MNGISDLTRRAFSKELIGLEGTAMSILLAVSVAVSAICSQTAVQADNNMAATGADGLVPLRRIYLSIHGLDWVGVTEDDPRRQEPRWELWPGRCALCHRLDFEFRLRIYQTIRNIKDDEGLMIVPSGNPQNNEMIAYARERLGPRCVVCEFDYNRDRFMKALGPDFAAELQEDRRRAEKVRAAFVDDAAFEHEFAAWERSKAWATDLIRKLNANGYTFNPKNVEFVAWGGDWCGCAATYPIQMGRAFGLAEPIKRRWDLIIRDCGPMWVNSELVVGNVKMPEHIRLFIFKNKNGRYCANYWEGLHCPMDPAHQVSLEFPAGSVRLVDGFGQQVGDETYGRVTVGVGAGGHTPHRPDILEASETLSLDDFYAALVKGEITEKE